MKNRKRNFALCGGLCGMIYFLNLLYPLPDFLRGFSLGLTIGFLLLALLPNPILEKWKQQKRKWMHRG